MAQIHKNISFTGIGQFLYTVMAFILIPFAIRYLGKEGYGLYSLAATLGFFVSLFTDPGLTTLVTREVSKNKKLAQKIFAYTLGIRTVLIPLTVVFLAFYFIIARSDRLTIQTISIFTISAIIGSFVQNAFAVFRGFEKMQFETIGVFTEKFFIVTLGITMLVMGCGILTFVSAFLIAAVIKLILSYLILKMKFLKIEFRFSPKRSCTIVKTAIPFGISIFLAVCYNYLGTIFLSVISDMNAVGVFSVSFKLMSFTTLIPTVLTTAFLPQLSLHFRDSKQLTQLFGKGVQYLFLFSIPMIPYIILQAKAIIGLIAGPGWEEAELPLQILVIAAFAQMLNSFFVALYAAVNRQKKIVHFQLIGLTLNIIFNYIFIHSFSFYGAAFATVITEWSILCLISVWACRNILSVNLQILKLSYLIRLIMATLLMCAVILGTQKIAIDSTIILILGMMSYALALQMVGCINYWSVLSSGIHFIMKRKR